MMANTRIKGVDVSHHQGKLDAYWDGFQAAGFKFAIVKVSEGLANGSPYDSGRKYYLPEFKQRGYPIGAYHYFRNDVNAEYQAAIFKAACGTIALDLPPALDVERINNPVLNGDRIKRCLVEIERLFGRKPIIYTNASTWDSIGDTWAANYDLWVASYRDSAPYMPKVWLQKGWRIWQYSDSEMINGRNFDHNWFNGDEADLAAFVNGAQLPDDPADPLPTAPAVKVVCPFLRLRNRPALYDGTTLIAEIGQVFEKAGETTNADGVIWQPVKLPAEYGVGRGYVSANGKYIEEVR